MQPSGVLPGQRPPQPAQPPQMHYGVSSWAVLRDKRIAIVLALITVAAIIVFYDFAIYLPAQEAARQPEITLSMSWQGLNCYVNGCVIRVGGTLANDGNADGYAVVNWVVNGNVTEQVRYLVPAHQFYGISLSQLWPEGNAPPSNSALELISVQKA